MEKTILSKSDDITQKIGEEFSNQLKPSDVIFLEGDLGAGKTTFTKGVAKGLGVNTRVISPSFVVVRIHRTNREDIQRIYHLDLYRLASEKEVKGVDIEDFLEDKNAVVMIEWPQKSKKIINKPYWMVKINNLENNSREITISKND